MKVTPVAGPQQIPVAQANVRTQAEIRAKAMAAFEGGGQQQQDAPPQRQQPQQKVVQNQNQIAVEEMGAVIPQPNIDTQTQSEQVETVVEDAPTEQKPAQDLAASRQFAQLARQTKEFRQLQQQLKAEKLAHQAEVAAFKASQQQAQAPSVDLSKYISKDRLLQDPISVIEENGLNYDELTQRYVTRAPIDPSVTRAMQAMQDEIKALKAANADNSKAQTEAQQQAYQGALRQIKNDAARLVKGNPEFEAIQHTQSVDDVVDLIEKTFKEDGIVLTVDEAAKEVENYLVEEAMKLTKIGKIQQRLQSSSNGQQTLQAQKSQNAQTQQQRPGMKTLTNAVGSTRQLSSKERAILAFNNQLHKG